MPRPFLTLSTLALLGLAALAALSWRPAGPAIAEPSSQPPPSLSATRLPDGRVRLDWALPAPAPGRLQLRRATDPAALAAPAGRPVASWELPGRSRGHWIDPAPADGVTYHYGLAGATAKVAMPARVLPVLRSPRLRIDKRTYVLAVHDGDRVAKRYAIALGRAPASRKLHFDNASTPEGLYRIVGVQPRATYHRAYDLDYPNMLDRVRHRVASAGRADFPAIGGEIQVHGRGIETNWTFGCVALRDADMDELFDSRAIGVGTEVRLWGGELTESQVDALATAPDAATLARYRRALAARGFASDGRWGPGLWEAIGRFQRSAGLPLTCQPDAATARALPLW